MHKSRKERTYDNGGIPAELVRKFLKEYDLKDGKSISDFLKKSFGTFIQEALENELDQELGYSRYNYQTKETSNSRNGHHKKTLRTDMGPVEIQVPQDTEGEFEPVIVPKHSREVNPDIQDAIKAVFPQTEIQRCIVHQIRNSCKYIPWKDRKSFCADMKKIYKAINEEQALIAFGEFSEKWGKKYPYAIKRVGKTIGMN